MNIKFLKNLSGYLPPAMFVLLLATSRGVADVIYVWSGDSTIQKIQSNGVCSVIYPNLSGWNGPVGLAVDNVGNLYSGCPGESSIRRYTPDGNMVLMGSSVDSVSAIAFDKSANLVGTIPNYAGISRLLFSYGQYFVYPYSPFNAGALYPISLTFDQAGNFYVANNWSVCPVASYYPTPTSGDNIIEKFSANYADLGIYVTNLNQPWGLAFDKAGALYIANSGTAVLLKNSILKVTADGSRQVFASSIRGLNQPRGIAFDSSGNLFVANSGAGNILKFTPAGAVSVFASGLNLPTSIAIYPGLNSYATTPVQLINTTRLTNGAIQLNLSEPGGLTFGVLAATNATMPLSNWTTIGSFNEVSAGQYQFTDTQATNSAQQFYRAKLQ